MKRNIIISLLLLLIMGGCHPHSTYVTIDGTALGTDYRVVYKTPQGAGLSFKYSIKKDLKRAAKALDHSLSIENDYSVISSINSNKKYTIDSIFTTVYDKALEVNKATGGYYDITLQPLVEFWEQQQTINLTPPQQQTLDSLRQFVGMDKIWIEDGKLWKADARVRINLNSLSKGYATDFLARILDKADITDYIVQLGHEAIAKGKNPAGNLWRMDIDASIQDCIYLNNKAFSLSGNYQNTFHPDSIVISKSLNPHSGMPNESHLICSIVICQECFEADAYSSAFMAMGSEKSFAFVQDHPEFGAIFVIKEQGEAKTIATENISQKYEIQYYP